MYHFPGGYLTCVTLLCNKLPGNTLPVDAMPCDNVARYPSCQVTTLPLDLVAS